MNRKPIGLSVPYRKVDDPKTKWVGLTPDEINEIKHSLPDVYSMFDVARAVEAKLKNKNK